MVSSFINFQAARPEANGLGSGLLWGGGRGGGRVEEETCKRERGTVSRGPLRETWITQ